MEHEGLGIGSTLVVATDGSCLSNPGPGGWCAFVNTRCWIAGAEKPTTNNRMELLAVVATLESVPAHVAVHVLADSRYLIDAATKWRFGWRRKGWVTANGAPVKNQDLIVRLDGLLSGRQVSWEWVRGHTGHHLNEAADVRARAAAGAIAAGRRWEAGPGLDLGVLG